MLNNDFKKDVQELTNKLNKQQEEKIALMKEIDNLQSLCTELKDKIEQIDK